MIIIGDGLTACIAGMMNQQARLIAGAETPKHKAIMRFRTPDIERITGIRCKEVTITKSAYWDGEHHSSAPINIANEYSKKVSGGFYDRSITNLDKCTRWVPPEDLHDRLLDMIGSRLTYGKQDSGAGEVRITTLPLAYNAALYLEDYVNTEFIPDYTTIYVNKFRIHKCNLWHTTYFPRGGPYYRMSIEGDIATIESVLKLNREDIIYAFASMGMDYDKDEVQIVLVNYEQRIGKIHPAAESARKTLIHQMSVLHNVYSLGRKATWRNILLDDVVKDVYQINKMIHQNDYDLRIPK